MTTTRGGRLGGPILATATLLCLALGVAGALRVVGVDNLRASDGERVQPIAFDDYALQFYYGQLGARHLREGGVTYGYDPNFMAGYPKTPVYYPSSKPFEYTLALFAGSDPGVVFNRSIFAMIALGPLLIFLAALNFGAPPGERLAATALASVPHLLVPMAGFYGIMEAAGMVPYIFSSFLSVYVVSLVDRFLARGERGTAVLLLIVAPLLYRSHLTAAFVSAVPIAASYLRRFRRAGWARHAWLWAVLATIVFANWSWIQGYLLYSHYSDLSDFYSPEGSVHFVPKGGWLSPFLVHIARPALLSLAPALFGIAGLVAWWRARRFDTLALFVPQLAFLFVVSFYGAFLGLNPLAPARITLPLCLYLLFPAAHGLTLASRFAVERLARALPRVPRTRIATALVALGAVALALSSLPRTVWRPYTLPKLELREGFSEHGLALIDWLARNTDPSGRLLHEETDRDHHRYYGSHAPAWIPLFSDLEMAGSPAPHALLQHNFLRFIAGTFQGRPLRETPPKKLRETLSLYNVRWLLVWKPETRRRFERLKFTTYVGSYDKFALFRVETPPDWFVRGSGRIEVDAGRIRLSELVPEDGVVTLKYHWLEALRTDPPVEITPVRLLDDPVPWISLVDPPSELEIYNDYEFGLGDAPR